MPEYWVTCSTPQYFPLFWKVQRMVSCHELIVLDDARFRPANRNHVSIMIGPAGPFDISIPYKGRPFRPANEMVLRDHIEWRDRLLKQVWANYNSRRGYRELYQSLEHLLTSLTVEGTTIADVGVACLRWVNHVLALNCKVTRSSELIEHHPNELTEWRATVCKRAGATDCLQGANSINTTYKPGVFSSMGINLWGQKFSYWPFKQRHRHNFYPQFCILDVLMFKGSDFVRWKLKADQPKGNSDWSMYHVEDNENSIYVEGH